MQVRFVSTSLCRKKSLRGRAGSSSEKCAYAFFRELKHSSSFTSARGRRLSAVMSLGILYWSQADPTMKQKEMGANALMSLPMCQALYKHYIRRNDSLWFISRYLSRASDSYKAGLWWLDCGSLCSTGCQEMGYGQNRRIAAVVASKASSFFWALLFHCFLSARLWASPLRRLSAF